DALNLSWGKLHWGFTTEDGDKANHLAGFFINFRNRCRYGRKWAGQDSHCFANDVVVCVLLSLFLLRHGDDLLAFGGICCCIACSCCAFLWQQELRHIAVLHWGGIAFVAHEAGDTWGVTNNRPRGIVKLHPHQDITWQQFTLDELLLAVFVFQDLLDRHNNIEDGVFYFQRLRTHIKVGLYLVFVAGVALDDVPLTRKLLELLGVLAQTTTVIRICITLSGCFLRFWLSICRLSLWCLCFYGFSFCWIRVCVFSGLDCFRSLGLHGFDKSLADVVGAVFGVGALVIFGHVVLHLQ